MLSRLTLSQKGILFLSIFLVLQMAFVAVLFMMERGAQQQIEEGLHTQQVILHMNKLSNLWSQLAVVSVRALSYRTIDELPEADAVISSMHGEFRTLDQLLEKSSKSEKDDLVALEKDTNDGLAILGKAHEAWLYNNGARYSVYLKSAGELMTKCTTRSNDLLNKFMESERRNHEEQGRDKGKVISVLVIGLSANVSLAIFMALLFTSGIAHRLEHISDNSVRLAHGIPLYPALTGDDEIDRLDQKFHEMADLLVEAARKERAVVDHARDLICALDADLVFVTVNPAARAVLGYESEDLVGKFYLDIVAEQDRLRTNTMLQNLIGGGAADPVENSVLAKNGESVDVLLSAHWSETDKSLFCIMHDITQRRQVERMKRQFIAMITHDLRSPLTAIGNTLHMMGTRVYSSESEKGQTRINEASQNISRMLKLISDLLEMEKFDAAALILDCQLTSIPSLIEESIGSVRAYAEQQRLSIESQSPDLMVKVDRLRLVQVLVNLLANAIKFSPPGSLVEVGARLNADSLLIEVKDSGSGISEEDQQMIFDPYKQAKRKDGEKRLEGTGLGLTICKSIVEAHKGQIGVRKGEPKGSIFWIILPLEQPDSV